MSNIKKEIRVDGDCVFVTLYRGLGTENAEACEYQINVTSEGLTVDAVEDEEIIPLDAYDHVWVDYVCPGCEGSEEPGMIYNNNDPTSGQGFPCPACNADQFKGEHAGT